MEKGIGSNRKLRLPSVKNGNIMTNESQEKLGMLNQSVRNS